MLPSIMAGLNQKDSYIARRRSRQWPAGFAGIALCAVFLSLLSFGPGCSHHGRYGPEGGLRRNVQKTVENSQLQFIKVVFIPVVTPRRIPRSHRPTEIPQLLDKVVDVPVVQVVRSPRGRPSPRCGAGMVQIVRRIIEIPQFVDTVADVPVVRSYRFSRAGCG